MVQEEMSFEDVSYLKTLVAVFNHLCNFGRNTSVKLICTWTRGSGNV